MSDILTTRKNNKEYSVSTYYIKNLKIWDVNTCNN